MKTYLVTGGAGFIGSNLIERLLSFGKVICVDNFSDYYDPKIKDRNIEKFLGNENFKLYREDICNIDAMDRIFADNKPDCIINLAAKAGVRDTSPDLYVKTNIAGMVNILELANKYNAKKVITASSSSVYGNRDGELFEEDMKVDRPISIYAASKLSAENLCSAYSYIYGLSIICLRFFTVYGPKQRPDMAVSKFVRQIFEGKPVDLYGQGEPKRDFTYVDDIVQGIIKSIDFESDFEIFNLGSGQVVKLKDLIDIISEKIGRKAVVNMLPLPKSDVFYTASDISKAKKLLGYKPEIDIRLGIEKYLDWLKNERVD